VGRRPVARLALLVVAACGSGGRTTPAPATTASGPQPIVSIAIWPARWATIAALGERPHDAH
jgi:hypothetical protein